ncbi:helix-turn-helix domain-containing protein [Aliikangiella sp. IMCC44359]|uniref:helix-turn-helix domain-containing protein n=1 Tax=Aliikangiella sp. IMCC44359 TaxID=3459125 RepID=UPI00403B1F32
MKEIVNGRVSLNSEYLKSLRNKLGLSQDKLADLCAQAKLCVSISSIKRAESGKKLLYRTVESLAKFFNVSIEELIDNGESPLLMHSLQKRVKGDNNHYVLLELNDNSHWTNLKTIQNEKGDADRDFTQYLNGLINNNKVNVHLLDK